jgi:hypothetical protein
MSQTYTNLYALLFVLLYVCNPNIEETLINQSQFAGLEYSIGKVVGYYSS